MDYHTNGARDAEGRREMSGELDIAALRVERDMLVRALAIMAHKLAKRVDCPNCPAETSCHFPADATKCPSSLSIWAISEAWKERDG